MHNLVFYNNGPKPFFKFAWLRNFLCYHFNLCVHLKRLRRCYATSKSIISLLYATDLGVSNEDNPERYDHRELDVTEVELGDDVSDAFFSLRRTLVSVVFVIVSAGRVTVRVVRGGAVVRVWCGLVTAVCGLRRLRMMTVRGSGVTRQVCRRCCRRRLFFTVFGCRRRHDLTSGRGDVSNDDRAAVRWNQQTSDNHDDADDDDERWSWSSCRCDKFTTARHDREPTKPTITELKDTSSCALRHDR